MNNVRRFDIGSLKSPEKTPNGWLRVQGYLTRTGIFTYRNPDGTERRELRLADEVFRGNSMASFGLVPVTNDHPPELLTSENTSKYAVGAVSEDVRRDGEYVRASMLITDARAVAALEAGKTQLSCGYTCDLEFKEGTYDGERYDAIQRNIRGNHVAVVDVGRAGPEVGVRMDNTDVIMVGFKPIDSDAKSEPEEKTPMTKINFDGIELEASDALVQAVSKERAKFDSLKAERDSLEAKLDAANEKVKKAEADLVVANDPERIKSAVASRTALVTEAQKHIGEIKTDLSDREIKVAVIEKLKGVKLGVERSDEYVNSRYDGAIEDVSKQNPALAQAREAVTESTSTERKDATDEKAARARMMEENRNRWKSGGKK